jgi:predicted nucleic acid-binding protein
MEFAARLSARLGAGERSCLAVAYHREGLFVSDDADARKEAGRHEIPVTGTIGVLARAVEKSSISIEEGNRLLTRMIGAGYRSPVERLDDLL